MKYPAQCLIEALCYLIEVLQSQFAFIQLSIGEGTIDDFLNHPFDPRRRRVYNGPGSRLHHVSQHDKSSLFGLRLGTGISKVLFLHFDGLSTLDDCALLGLFVEKRDCGKWGS